MADTAKHAVKARTENHSDVADTPPARMHQQALTEKQFGVQLLARLREAKGELTLTNFREEWLHADDGMVYEISVDVRETE